MPSNNMDLTVALSVGGNADVKRALNDLGKAVRDTGKQIEDAGHSGDGFAEAGKALSEVMSRLTGLAGPAGAEIGELATAFTTLGAGIGGALAAVIGAGAALAGLAVHAAEAAKKIEEGAIRAGTSTDSYQGLSFALSQSGSSAEGMEKALSKISEAQSKAIESAKDYGEAATKIKQHNEAMRESAEKYADAVARINKEHANSKEDRTRDTAEALYRNQVETDRALEKDAQAGGKRRAEIVKDQEDKIFWIKREARLREEEDQRREQREQERLAEERYREQQEALRKYNLELEAAADKAAKSLSKFSKLGVELLNGTTARDTVEVYKDVANAIARIEEPAERAAKAVELFGRRMGTQLTESLAKGSKGIDDLIEEARKLGIILGPELLKVGKEAGESFEKMEAVIGAALNRVGLAFAPLLQKITDAISERLGASSKSIGDWADSVAKTLEPIFNDIANAIRGDLDKIQSPQVRVMVDEFIALAHAIEIVAAALEPVIKYLTLCIEVAAKLTDFVLGPLLDAWEKSSPMIVDAIKDVIGWVDWLIDKLEAAAKALGFVNSKGSGPPAGAPAEGHATGGMIHGPGGVDRVPAMLTAGEYVISKPAVDHYGSGMMSAINARHFALGGYVDRIADFMTPAPLAFAGGGSVPSAGARTPVHLHLDGRSFAMTADDHVVGSLTRYAAGRQMSSAGPKPSWYGGRS